MLIVEHKAQCCHTHEICKLLEDIHDIDDEKIKEIPDFPPVLSAELRHCILAHHGELEYGSPKKPALAEAAALNFADNTDAKLEIFKEMFEKGTEENSWLGWQQLLDSNIRKTEL